MLKNSKQNSSYPGLDTRLPLVDRRMLVLDGIADGYYETDLQGSLVAVNTRLCAIFGCESDADLLGDKYHHFLDELNDRRLRAAFAQVISSGNPASAVVCNITRTDGTPAWIELSVAPLRTVDGQVEGLRGIVRDISERHRVQETTNARYRQFLQISAELSDTLELDKVLDKALQSATTLSGAESVFIGLIEGERVQLARSSGDFKESWVPPSTGVIARVLSTHQSEWVEKVEDAPDYIPNLATTRAEIAIPLISRGKLIGVLNLETSHEALFTAALFERCQLLGAHIAAAIENARLYTKQQAQVEELSSKYAETSEQESLKTDMIRVAAHDLRAPLALVSSYIDLLEGDLKSVMGEPQQQFIQSIRQAVERMTQMTNDILSLERMNQHRDVTLMRVSLNSLLEHVVTQYADESRHRGQHIHIHAEPVAVYGDSTEILEAIANLIGNAVKYTPKGGEIEAHIRREDDLAVLEIIDSGYGVPADQIGKLFQPFQRIRTQETQDIDGTGLGLYLVKKIVERYKGQVYVHSDYGRGSTFGFKLPLAK